jgi:hypothetical protein
MRAFWKVLSIALFATGIGCGLISFSMYAWPNIPSSPRPAEGRIYPLNNHGHSTYMNRSEYLLRQAVWAIFPICLLGYATIWHFVDPFDQKKQPRALRPPPPW